MKIEAAQHLLDTDYLEEQWLHWLTEVERLSSLWEQLQSAEITSARRQGHKVIDGKVTWQNSKRAERLGGAINGANLKAQTYALSFLAAKARTRPAD